MTRPTRLLYVVTEDWYFCLHRMPLARAAATAGFEVWVATRVEEHRRTLQAAGLEVVTLDWRKRKESPLSLFGQVMMLRDVYRRLAPDIVHHIALKPCLLGSIAAQQARVPRIVNGIMGLGYAFSATTPKAQLSRACIRGLMRTWADRDITVTVENQHDRRIVTELTTLADHRILVTPGSGVDTQLFSPGSRRPSLKIRIGVAARLTKLKGIDLVVRAVAELRETGLDVELKIATILDRGSPTALGEETLTEWRQFPWLEVLVDHRNMPEFWRSVDIAALATLGGEGVPRSLIEAAACAVPIVASDVPGCRDLVCGPDGNLGLLFPAGSVEHLRNALRTLASDPQLRHRLGALGRRTVEAGWTDTHVNELVLAAYLDRGPRSARAATSG